MRKIVLKSSVASLAVLLSMPVAAQDAGDASSDEIDLEAEEIVVTGSRLLGGDGSTRTDVITADDIKAQGLSTVEDILRTIPQNYVGQSNFVNIENSLFGGGGQGVQSVNLRGLGSGNTLVLVNGRRRSSAAGLEDGFVNISNIPAAMIERVEVQLGGASAVYGSDAIGGVINIITKKRYTGLTAHARYDHSSTGADGYTADVTAGHSWDTGSITSTIGFQKTKPVINAKTGYVSRDYRQTFRENQHILQGELSDYDMRLTFAGQPGWVSFFSPFAPKSALPAGHDGVGATPGDFTSVMDPITPWFVSKDFSTDAVDQFHGSDVETITFDGHAEQRIGERLNLVATWSYTEVKNLVETTPIGGTFLVPATNAYNPFGMDAFVAYQPYFELQNGSVPYETSRNQINSLDLTFGFDYHIATDTFLRVNYTNSSNKSTLVSNRFTGNSGFGVDPEWASQVTSLLANSDPGQTVNLFGNGSAQTDLIGDLYFTDTQPRQKNITEQIDGYISGQIFDLPGGKLRYSVGAEYRTEKIRTNDDSFLVTFSTGIQPKRTAKAVYAELSVPIFSHASAIPFFNRLEFNAQARHDSYKASGARGSDDMGEPIIVDTKFSATSPRFGMVWEPAESLQFRASWSNSFRAPVFSDLFQVNPFSTPPGPYFDALAPGGPALVFIPRLFNNNPDIKPERSKQWDFGLEFTPESIEGLRLTIDYSSLNYQDRIVGGDELFLLLNPEDFAALPEFLLRDEGGNAVGLNLGKTNAISRISKDLTVDLSYRFDTDWGTFEPGINYSDVIKLHDNFSDDIPTQDLVGTARGLDEYRLRGRLAWNKDNWSALLGINYTPGYFNNSQLVTIFGEERGARGDVSSYTTADLTVSYRMDNGLTVRAGGRNITNEKFPLAIVLGRPYDSSRVDPRGRVLFLDLTFEM